MKNYSQKINVASISGLWTAYMADSASICIMKHFANHVDMKEAKGLLIDAIGMAEDHLEAIEAIFDTERIPIPDAFSDDDVDLNAPRLFTDPFYLFYLATMFGFGMDGYALISRYVARQDVMKFFHQALIEAAEFLTKIETVRIEKGLYVAAPRCEVSRKISYIEKRNFLDGLLGQPRPLLAREATNVFSGALIDMFMRALVIGFGQVTSSKQIKDFMFRGADIASNHFGDFAKILNDEHIPVPSISDEFVTDSTTAPFSDKLMMFQILEGTEFALGVDGAAIASSFRSDLLSLHTRFGSEILQYAADGMNIMIKNKWLEQPPQVIMHEHLTSLV